VACSSAHEEGYATAAFGVVALCFAMIATAVMALAGSQLQSAKRRLDYAVRDARLEGGLVLAANAIMRDARSVPFSWTQEVDGAAMIIIAEPEGLKAAAANPNGLGPALLEALAGQSALAPAPAPGSGAPLRQQRQALLDRSARADWRLCAQSFLSPLSASAAATPTPSESPSGDTVNWRVGEVWRVVAFMEGRGADALVRFTGDPDSPMAILDLRTAAMAKPDPARCHQLASPEVSP